MLPMHTYIHTHARAHTHTHTYTYTHHTYRISEVIATRDILKGDEITICYMLPMHQSHHARSILWEAQHMCKLGPTPFPAEMEELNLEGMCMYIHVQLCIYVCMYYKVCTVESEAHVQIRTYPLPC